MIIYYPLLFFFLISAFAQADDKEQQRDSNSNAASDDYHLYDLLEKVKTVTGQPCLYSLFSLSEGASPDDVSKAFRKLSRTFHPDKNPAAAPHHRLLSSTYNVLRNEKTRRRYAWLMHEAPGWHRSTVYAVRRMTRRGRMDKLGLGEVLVGMLLFSAIMQGLAQWIRWILLVIDRRLKQQHVAGLSKKEVKRMERKVDQRSASPLQTARAPLPPLPSPFDLWPCALPRYIFRSIVRVKAD